MKVLNISLAFIGVVAAIVIATDWYSGAVADAPTRALAIIGALYGVGSALERAFPFLKE